MIEGFANLIMLEDLQVETTNQRQHSETRKHSAAFFVFILTLLEPLSKDVRCV